MQIKANQKSKAKATPIRPGKIKMYGFAFVKVCNTDLVQCAVYMIIYLPITISTAFTTYLIQ